MGWAWKVYPTIPFSCSEHCTEGNTRRQDSSKSSFTKLAAGHRKELVKFLVETLDEDELELSSGLIGAPIENDEDRCP